MSDVFNPNSQSVDDLSKAIMGKLDRYALNLADPTCCDYLDGQIEKELTSKTRGNKKKKVSKFVSATTDA